MHALSLGAGSRALCIVMRPAHVILNNAALTLAPLQLEQGGAQLSNKLKDREALVAATVRTLHRYAAGYFLDAPPSSDPAVCVCVCVCVGWVFFTLFGGGSMMNAGTGRMKEAGQFSLHVDRCCF